METRSSPSLQVLQGLARQAHLSPPELSSLSKPALYDHLRSNYDYHRLERAHQTALKRGNRAGDACGSSSNGSDNNSSGSGNKPSLAPRAKRTCRVVGSVAGSGGSSSTAALSQEQNIPAASIFVRTRSRSKMRLAAVGGGGGGGKVGHTAPARVTASAKSRSTCSKRRCLKPSGEGEEEGGGGGSASGCKGGDTGSSSIGSSNNNGIGEGTSSATGALRTTRCASADSACSGGGGVSVSSGSSSNGVEELKAELGGGGAEASESTENTAKRKSRAGGGGGGGGSARASSPGRGGGRCTGKGKGKGKGKAKDFSCGATALEAKEHVCDARGGTKISNDVGGGGGGGGGFDCGGKEAADDNRAEVERPNELDPIMLVNVGKDHYRFVRPNGRVVLYNLDSLVDYFISTGDFLEPETRLPFSDDELGAIDVKVRAAGLSKPSVLEAKRDPSHYSEKKFQQDALVGLERMTSELVTGMLRVVEESGREEGEIRLVAELFPPFADLFKQIKAADRAFASQCMQHYRSWLQGPPNRRTEDEIGFLGIILGFLKQLQECDGNSSLGF